jgi:HTH-type transcriptional regulator / antitoxin HigA
MITNEKQYRSTRTLIDRLKASVDALEADTAAEINPILRKAQLAALASQIAELEDDVQLYDGLRSGAVTVFEADGLHDLPDILIQARIARAMSQRDLADYIGVKEQQIQRYEAERYRSASLERLTEVAAALHIHVRERAELVGDGRFSKMDPEAFKAFPITEMYKRGYFADFEGTLAQARKSAPILVPAFFHASHTTWASTALHRKSVRATGQVHEAAIAAWEARVLYLAERYPSLPAFDRSAINGDWLAALTRLSRTEAGPQRAVGHLGDIGIALVIEPHLPGTLLDGAALCTARDTPVVAMTLRHDRLDNFWFTMLHEIAHLALHVGGEGSRFRAIFDDTEAVAKSEVETEADTFAQEALLPTVKWRACLSRFSRTERAVRADAEKFEIHPAIIAGRIRREAQDYTLLRGLVGAGEVRRQFKTTEGEA